MAVLTTRYGIGSSLTGSLSVRAVYAPVTCSQLLAFSPAGTAPVSPTLTGWASAAQQVMTIRVRYQPPLSLASREPGQRDVPVGERPAVVVDRAGGIVEHGQPDRVAVGQRRQVGRARRAQGGAGAGRGERAQRGRREDQQYQHRYDQQPCHVEPGMSVVVAVIVGGFPAGDCLPERGRSDDDQDDRGDDQVRPYPGLTYWR